MKTIFYEKNSDSSLVIEKKFGSSVMIIARGSESPFDYLSKLNSEIEKLSKDKDMEVFIDTLLYTANTKKHILKVMYSGKKKHLLLETLEKLTIKESPEEIKNILTGYYIKNREEIDDANFFTKHKKETLSLYLNGLVDTNNQ